ncbi:putative membrane protein [Campylobacter iguaniorum]|uniref:hypothetical protein n=1 Tax=Campylobacter iguaniorum TaxID=1244531 RepID=UPI00073A2FEC|nr:hypothetical protein [Campylobacter iguaniorum]ALV23853.1 putative membrane protein [Campylobacter iguaniorum]
MAGIFLIFICMLHAFICLLPGFIAGFFYDIERYKKWIFLVLTSLLCVALNLSKISGFSAFASGFMLDFVGIYFGLIILIGFRNMAKKAGLCKICDKFRRKS